MEGKRLAAVELLMSYPESVVAEMLGVRPSTVVRWMREDDFTEALRERERLQRSGLARIARQAALKSAVALAQAASEPGKSDAKVLIDLVKASGAFEAEASDPAGALADIISRAMRPEEEAADGNASQ